MKITFKHNVIRVAGKLRAMPTSIGRHLAVAIKKSAFLVERHAKIFTPVDTGRLRGSIAADIHPMKATIEPHTNYAIYVHEGTRFMVGRPFMTKGKTAAMPEIRRIFKNELKKAIK